MDLIVKYEWPPNSPDFNHLTINVWGAMLQTFYKLNLKSKTILELKGALQQIRDDLPQTSQYRQNACTLADCKNFENHI